MIYIRPIKESDRDDFFRLAKAPHIGITSLPSNPALLEKKLEEALQSFQGKGDFFYFILEDFQEKKVAGISALIARTEKSTPFYFYKKKDPYLNPETHKGAPTEICSLYLDPAFRKGGLGRLLSFCRFLFIAQFQEKFESSVFAEMRGYIEEDNICPFWEAVGRKSYDVDYLQLMEDLEQGVISKKELIAKEPIHIPSLSKKAQSAIGKVHKQTEPALKILEDQGFTWTGEIDVLDAGPRILAKTKNIKMIEDLKSFEVKHITDNPIDSPKYIFSNSNIDFRACLGQADVIEGKINKDVQKLLDIHLGETINYSPLYYGEH